MAGPVLRRRLPGPNTITCTSENAIQDESSIIFTFTFHVAPGLSNGTQVTNSANISHEGLGSKQHERRHFVHVNGW